MMFTAWEVVLLAVGGLGWMWLLRAFEDEQ